MSDGFALVPRRLLSLRALGVTEADLVDAVCDFVDYARPTDSAVRLLLLQAFTRLDMLPGNVLRTIADLSDAAEMDNLSEEHIPSIPGPVIEAVMYFDVLLSRLTADELYTTAQQMTLTQGTATVAALGIVREESELALGTLSDDAGYGHHVRIGEMTATLGDHGADQWSSTDLAIVRRALRMNLADLGDGYLRLSEWGTRQLNWRQPTPGTWSAEDSVKNAHQPLEARIEVRPAPRSQTAVTELLPPHHVRRHSDFQWSIGWRVSNDRFCVYEQGHESSVFAAIFAVEATIDPVVAHVATLRMPLSHELVAHDNGDVGDCSSNAASASRPLNAWPARAPGSGSCDRSGASRSRNIGSSGPCSTWDTPKWTAPRSSTSER
ncbi:hypothetical protein ACFXO9_31295 [Nocardia tengchongensis]|uniref:hypothetical protein n=1 Tax=Nocardia tengchongensis TaxID=2055889 RepID=UPI0036D199BD